MFGFNRKLKAICLFTIILCPLLLNSGGEIKIVTETPSQTPLLSTPFSKLQTVTIVSVSVYNATSQGGIPYPDTELHNEAFGALPDTADNQWHSFEFSTPINLDPSYTYSNAFFIVVIVTVGAGGKFEWAYELDSVLEDYGAAYSYSEPNWNLQNWDFNMKVGFANISRKPTSIALEINGTPVLNKNDFDGAWISTNLYSETDGNVTFVITSNISAKFEINWLTSYRMEEIGCVTTAFLGYATNSVIYWNATCTSFID
ncbi:MAG: hypothetical protein ACTSRS_07495 [Candidatus Helarchaeota archaeon]